MHPLKSLGLDDPDTAGLEGFGYLGSIRLHKIGWSSSESKGIANSSVHLKKSDNTIYPFFG